MERDAFLDCLDGRLRAAARRWPAGSGRAGADAARTGRSTTWAARRRWSTCTRSRPCAAAAAPTRGRRTSTARRRRAARPRLRRAGRRVRRRGPTATGLHVVRARPDRRVLGAPDGAGDGDPPGRRRVGGAASRSRRSRPTSPSTASTRCSRSSWRTRPASGPKTSATCCRDDGAVLVVHRRRPLAGPGRGSGAVRVVPGTAGQAAAPGQRRAGGRAALAVAAGRRRGGAHRRRSRSRRPAAGDDGGGDPISRGDPVPVGAPSETQIGGGRWPGSIVSSCGGPALFRAGAGDDRAALPTGHCRHDARAPTNWSAGRPVPSTAAARCTASGDALSRLDRAMGAVDAVAELPAMAAEDRPPSSRSPPTSAGSAGSGWASPPGRGCGRPRCPGPTTSSCGWPASAWASTSTSSAHRHRPGDRAGAGGGRAGGRRAEAADGGCRAPRAAVRLFVAVYPPASAVDHLVYLRLRAAGRASRRRRASTPGWPARTRVHVTLAFLGDVADERLDRGDRSARRARSTARRRACAWPAVARFGRGKFTVLWAGLGGDVDALAALAGAARRSLKQARLPYDDRPWKPHLTLARPGDRLDRAAVDADRRRARRLRGPTWPAGEVVLMRSHLGPKPTYDRLAAWPLRRHRSHDGQRAYGGHTARGRGASARYQAQASGPGPPCRPAGTARRAALSVSSDSVMSSARSGPSSCSMVRGPMIGAVTPGRDSSQASATFGRVVAEVGAQLLVRLDRRPVLGEPVGGAALLARWRVAARPACGSRRRAARRAAATTG